MLLTDIQIIEDFNFYSSLDSSISRDEFLKSLSKDRALSLCTSIIIYAYMNHIIKKHSGILK